MKYFIFISFLICFTYSVHAQIFPSVYPDTIMGQPTEDSKVKVTTINLEGDYYELVISVAFLNKTSEDYPLITQATNYPKCGMFENGTPLEEYLQLNGPLPMDQWYGPALNKYYNTLSGGIYTADFNFLKTHAGKRFKTPEDWAYYVALNGGSPISVVHNKVQAILDDVAETVFNEYPYIFNNVDCIHFTFEGLSADEFWHGHGGTAWTNFDLETENHTLLYSGPISIQLNASAIAHERLHIIGAISGSPSSFNGFPDRGFDVSAGIGHHNMFFSYDMMYHNSSFLDTYSLYGLPPLLTHDLIFLGWIKPEEILKIDANNFTQFDPLKLADVNYPLTTQQLADGFKRIVKVMIKENYAGDKDEYFLIENHQATEFDKAFTNYDEGLPNGEYNKGILVWHIKEDENMINTFHDNYIDLEVAVPYDDWYGNPIVPPIPSPANYNRPTNWNDNWAADYDYQDDNLMTYSAGNWIYSYPPDGGRHIWETTVPTPHPWYPPDPNYFHRLESMSSDFFTDQEIRGHITDRMTDATRPSTKTWGGLYTTYNNPSEKTHIAIKNIQRETGYMALRILYNYWEGEVTANSNMSGDVTIGDNLTVAAGVTLTIAGGTKINFDDDYANMPNRSKLTVYGTLRIDGGSCAVASNGYLKLEPGSRVEFTASSQLQIDGVINAIGTPSNKIIFDRVTGVAEITWGVLEFAGSSASSTILDNVEVKHGAGLQCKNGASITIQNSLIENCLNGIYIYNAAPTIFNNEITDPTYYGIYGETLGYDPLIKDNKIKKLNINVHQYQGIYFTNNDAATHICGNDIQGFSTGLYLTGGGQIYFWDNNYITPYPNNRFGDNVIGLTSAYGSYIGGGINDSWGCYNSMVSNSSFDASAHHYGQMNVQYNWWGSDGAQLSTGNGGIINASNALDYDPWASSKSNIIVNGEPTSNGDGVDEIIQALSLERDGRIPELISLCKQIIRDNGNTNFAISELIYIKLKHHISNIRDYLDSLMIGYRPFKAKLIYYVASLSLHEGNYNIARILYNKIINDFPNSREAVDARFEKFFAALNVLENGELAGQLLSEIQSLGINDEDFLMHLEMAENLYDGMGSSHFNKPTSNAHGKEEIKNYALFDNFPNPFNPTTTIRYQLPQNGFVTLKIYDILGKEVAKLVNEKKTQGKYTVNFNASTLASGVYIYQLQVNDYIRSKKMLLLK